MTSGSTTTASLAGKVALVAGATRGAGRGIARALGSAGATVYCTGRSDRAHGSATPGRTETIDDTVEMIVADGGRAIAVRVDHTREDEVMLLASRIGKESGRLDVLVNDIWGGDALVDWGRRFWELDLSRARELIDRAVMTHLITSRHLAPLMVDAERGLIVEIMDGRDPGYRGHVLYDMVKAAVVRLAYGMAMELVGTGVTTLALSPGFLRSEAVLDHFGVTEATWQDAIADDPFFAESESPLLVGRAVAALAADPHVGRKAGMVFLAADLAEEYDFTDVDGRRPRFFPKFDERVGEIAAGSGPLDEEERFLAWSRYCQIHKDPSRHAQAVALARRLRIEGGDGVLPRGTVE